MQDNTKKITFGAAMAALFVMLLVIGVYIPLIGFIVSFLAPLPILLYRLRYDRMTSIFIVIGGLLLSLIVSPILFPFAVLFGALGIIIGESMQSNKSKLYIFMASGLVILGFTMITYVASIFILKVNVIEESMDYMSELQEESFTLLEKYGELPDQLREQTAAAMDLMLTIVPSTFAITSFGIAFLIITLNLAILKKMGHKPPSFPPFRTLRFPSIIVWCYLLILLFPLFTKVEEGTTLFLMIVNATFILRFLFLLQGISFLQFYVYEKKLPKWLAILATIIAVLLSSITTLIGILDIGMNIRRWIRKEKSN